MQTAPDPKPAAQGIAPGLTTTKAPFIEHAKAEGQLYIVQPYELYSEENHRTWARLLARMRPRWERYANAKFLEGVEALHLDPERVPRMEDVNRFLQVLEEFPDDLRILRDCADDLPVALKPKSSHYNHEGHLTWDSREGNAQQAVALSLHDDQ